MFTASIIRVVAQTRIHAVTFQKIAGGGEYEVQNCLLGCILHGSTSQKTILNITESANTKYSITDY
jgi:hypothetical protein